MGQRRGEARRNTKSHAGLNSCLNILCRQQGAQADVSLRCSFNHGLDCIEGLGRAQQYLKHHNTSPHQGSSQFCRGVNIMDSQHGHDGHTCQNLPHGSFVRRHRAGPVRGCHRVKCFKPHHGLGRRERATKEKFAVRPRAGAPRKTANAAYQA